MKREQLAKKERGYRRSQRKTAMDRCTAVTKMRKIEAEWSETEHALQRQLQHDMQLQDNLMRLIESGRFDVYEMYTSERLRVARIIYELQQQCDAHERAHQQQHDRIAELARKERCVDIKISAVTSQQRTISDEARLNEHQIHEANSYA